MSRVEEVTIEVVGPLARVAPPCPDLLGHLLSYSAYDCRAGGPRGYRLERRPAPLYRDDGRGRLVTLAGLVPRLERELTALGRRVVVRDATPVSPRLVPDRRALAGVDAEDAAYLRAVLRHRRGQAVIAHDQQPVGLIAAACRLYPAARALVVAPTRRRVAALARRLAARLRGQVATTVGLGAGPHLGARVLVTTTHTFPHAARDTDPFELLFFADAARSVDAAVAGAGLVAIQHQKVFGFVRRGEVRSEAAGLFLEGVCGPVIYEAPGWDGRDARVRVIVVEAPWSPAVTAATALDYKKQAVWHNRVRNEFIAALAGGLTGGEDHVLFGRGLLHRDTALPAAGEGGRRVVVLVESTEHGRQLRRLLPGWPLFSSPTAAAGSRPPDSGLPQSSIVTLVAARALHNVDVAVLVRAGGGAGTLEVPGYPPPATEARSEVAVIDLADGGGDTAEADTRSRLRASSRDGWRVDGPPRWLRPVG
jgi:hypothetical protein